MEQYIQTFIQYLLSPMIIIGAFYWMFIRTYEVGKFSQQLSDLLREFKVMKKEVSVLKRNMDIVRTHLVGKTGMNSSLFISNSPIQLTPKGKRFLSESGFLKIYKKEKRHYTSEIKKYKIRNMADVDEASYKVLEEYRDSDKYADFKQYAYENGITIDVLIKVFAIYFREDIAKDILPSTSP